LAAPTDRTLQAFWSASPDSAATVVVLADAPPVALGDLGVTVPALGGPPVPALPAFPAPVGAGAFGSLLSAKKGTSRT
jgi:hypothetical protein